MQTPRPKSESSHKNSILSPHKKNKTISSLVSLESIFGPIDFECKHKPIVPTTIEVKPVIPTVDVKNTTTTTSNSYAFNTFLVPVRKQVKKEPVWEIARTAFHDDLRRSIARTEQKVLICLSHGISDSESAYEICDIMEIIIENISKQRIKTRHEYEKRQKEMLKRAGKSPFFEKQNAEECCSVALWMSDVVSRFSHHKKCSADLLKKIDELNHYPAFNWHADVVARTSGKTSMLRRRDVYFHTPTGHKLRSRPDVLAFLTLFPKYKEAVRVSDGSFFELKPEHFSFNSEIVSRHVPVRLATHPRTYDDDDDTFRFAAVNKKKKIKKSHKEVIIPPKQNIIPIWKIAAKQFALELAKCRVTKIHTKKRKRNPVEETKQPKRGDLVEIKIEDIWTFAGNVVRVRESGDPYRKRYVHQDEDMSWIITTKLRNSTKTFQWNRDVCRIRLSKKRKKKTTTIRKRKCSEITSKSKSCSTNEHDNCCGICLESSWSSGMIGLPVNCSHVFCFDCINKWTKVTNTCPTCKTRFRKLLKCCTCGSAKNNIISISSSQRKKLKLNSRVKDDILLVKDILKIRKRNQRHVHYNDESVPCLSQSLECRVRLGDISSSQFCVQCDRCETWFHGECMGFRSAQQLCDIDQWFCSQCSN